MRKQSISSIWFYAELCGTACEFPRGICSPFPYHQLDTIYFPRPHTCLSYFPSHISSDKHIHTYTRNSMEPKGGIKPFRIARLAVPLLLVLVRPFPLLPASPPHCRWQSVLGWLVSRALRQELCSVTRGGLQDSGPSLYMEASPAPVSNNGLPVVLYKVSS